MSAHWSTIQENTAVFGIRLLYWIYRLTGRVVFFLSLWPVVTAYWILLPQLRRVSLDYFRHLHAFEPSAPRAGLPQSLRHTFRFADTILDKLLAAAGHFKRDDIAVEGAASLNADPRGAILVTAHTGCNEVGRALAQQFSGRSIRILTHTKHAGTFKAILERLHPGFTANCIEVTEITPAVALELQQTIQAGDFVVIVGDRTPIHSNAQTPVSFLGETALMPTGAYVLGAILQAPVWTMLSTRNSQGKARYHFSFTKLWEPQRVNRAERQKLFAELAQQFARELEKTVVRSPYDWFNFYDFWDREPRK
jgi:predicted LPLAT superfamily acyltransferase